MLGNTTCRVPDLQGLQSVLHQLILPKLTNCAQDSRGTKVFISAKSCTACQEASPAQRATHKASEAQNSSYMAPQTLGPVRRGQPLPSPPRAQPQPATPLPVAPEGVLQQAGELGVAVGHMHDFLALVSKGTDDVPQGQLPTQRKDPSKFSSC